MEKTEFWQTFMKQNINASSRRATHHYVSFYSRGVCVDVIYFHTLMMVRSVSTQSILSVLFTRWSWQSGRELSSPQTTEHFFFPAELTHTAPNSAPFRHLWALFTRHRTRGFYFYISCITSYSPHFKYLLIFSHIYTCIKYEVLNLCRQETFYFKSLIYNIMKCYIPICILIGFVRKISHV